MFEKLAKKIINNYTISNFKKIRVKSGKCRFNLRCQMNAVHDAIRNKEEKIAMVMYIYANYFNIHFINVNKNNEFIDNTVGEWAQTYSYYLVKYIYKKDFFIIDSIFTNFRKELRNKLGVLKFFTSYSF